MSLLSKAVAHLVGRTGGTVRALGPLAAGGASADILYVYSTRLSMKLSGERELIKSVLLETSSCSQPRIIQLDNS